MRRFLLASMLLLATGVAYADLSTGLSAELSLCKWYAGPTYYTEPGHAMCKRDCPANTVASCKNDSGGLRRVKFETGLVKDGPGWGGAGQARWNINECAPGTFDRLDVCYPGSWAEQGYCENWQKEVPEHCVLMIGEWAKGYWHGANDTNDGGVMVALRRIAIATEYFVEYLNPPGPNQVPIAVWGSSGGCLAATGCPLVYTDDCQIAQAIDFLGCISGGTHWNVQHQCNGTPCGPLGNCVDNTTGAIGVNGEGPGWHTMRKQELDAATPGGAGCAALNAGSLPNDSIQQFASSTPWGGDSYWWVGTANGGNDDDINGVVWGAGHMYNWTEKLTGNREWYESTQCSHGDANDITSNPSCAAVFLQKLFSLDDSTPHPTPPPPPPPTCSTPCTCPSTGQVCQ